MLQDPRTFGWLIIFAAGGIGMVLMALTMILFRRKLFARWLSMELRNENDRLARHNNRLSDEVEILIAENSRMRSLWGQAQVKATQGAAIMLSAFGIDMPDRGSDDD